MLAPLLDTRREFLPARACSSLTRDAALWRTTTVRLLKVVIGGGTSKRVGDRTLRPSGCPRLRRKEARRLDPSSADAPALKP
jgi:hypothetical protein